MISRFVPLPGTPIYDELVDLGEIPSTYMPPQTFSLFLPFQKKLRQEMYNPTGFEKFSLFWLLLREHAFLLFRNPRSVVYFAKYYGIENVIKKLFYLDRSAGDPTAERYGSLAYKHSE